MMDRLSMSRMARRPMLYVLDEAGAPLPIDTDYVGGFLVWAEWMAEQSGKQCRVDRTSVTRPGGDEVLVSTIFLGVDTRLSGRPLLWETAVHDAEGWQTVTRDASAELAHQSHEDTVRRLEAGLPV